MSNSFWQREKRMKKMNSTLLFSVKAQSFGNQKTKKAFGKGRRRRSSRRCSKRFKEYVEKLFVKVVKDVMNVL